MNPNVRFGRSIQPIQIKDVQKGDVQILYNTLSVNPASTNITVGAEPVALVVFGLKVGEFVTIENVFNGAVTPLIVEGEAQRLDADNTLVVLPVTGIYRCWFPFDLGDVVVIAYPLSAMNDKAKRSIALTNPNGPQQNRPNLFLDGSAGEVETKDFWVGDVPIVFRAYGLTDQTLHLYTVFEELQNPVVETDPVTITADNATLIISIAGAYKFIIEGESAGVVLVANPTTLNYTSGYLYKGEKGDIGPAGPSGAGYTHTQASPSAIWTINHNLGYKPSVELLTVGGAEFDADVIHASINQTLVYIAMSIAGTARLT